MTQEQILKNILKVQILADIIEAEIVAINPIKTIQDYKTMMSMNSLQNSCKRFRSRIDGTSEIYATATGEISDIVDEQINLVL